MGALKVLISLSVCSAEEMDIIVKWPMEVFVDNRSGISFQQSTNPNTKLRGIYDMREAWGQESTLEYPSGHPCSRGRQI